MATAAEQALNLLEELVDEADAFETDADFVDGVDGGHARRVAHLLKQARIVLKRPRRDPPDNPRG